MPALEPLYNIFGKDLRISKNESFILELEFFRYICDEFLIIFKNKYLDYFLLIKTNVNKEIKMLEKNLIKFLILDILDSGEYSLEGIATYIKVPIDLVQDIASGLNLNPSVIFFRRIIELHRLIRKEVYENIMKKIVQDYLEAEKNSEI